jgi:hypothetical protein
MTDEEWARLGPRNIDDIKNDTEAKCGHHGQLLNGDPCPDCFPEWWREKMRRGLMKYKDKINTEELDVLIHQCKAEEAARINNQGIEAQLEYLVDWVSPDELLELVSEARALDG